MAIGMTGEDASQAMLAGLTELIRRNLRARILEAIEPAIQHAIEAACETFKANVESMMDPARGGGVVNVLIRPMPRKDKPPC